MPQGTTCRPYLLLFALSAAGCVLLSLGLLRSRRRYRFMKSLAEKDSLTLLYNHGAFLERLSVELERASRYERELAVIMLDLDGFKAVNDAHGHLAGDQVLRGTASILLDHLRKSDIAARFGGDEFAVILPETDLEAAGVIAERISAGIANARFPAPGGEPLRITGSIGYVACGPDSPGRAEILEEADRLMFESKREMKGGVKGRRI